MRGLNTEAIAEAEKSRKAKAFKHFMATRHFPALNNLDKQSTNSEDSVVFVLQPKSHPAGRSGATAVSATRKRRGGGREGGRRRGDEGSNTLAGKALPDGTFSPRSTSQMQEISSSSDNNNNNNNNLTFSGKKTRSPLGMSTGLSGDPQNLSALQQFRMTVLNRLKRENKKGSQGVGTGSIKYAGDQLEGSMSTTASSLPVSPRSPRSPRSMTGSLSPRSRVIHSKAFSPCNPAKAKVTIRREGKEAFLGGKHIDVRDVDRKHAHMSRNKFIAGDFKPNSSSKAKRGIQVSYFLNSADEAALRAERLYMKQKANKNLKAFLEKLSAETRQGQKKKERASHEEVTIIASNSAEGGGVAGGGASSAQGRA